MKNFIKHFHVDESSESFSDPIKKLPLETFEDRYVKAKITTNGKHKEIHI